MSVPEVSFFLRSTARALRLLPQCPPDRLIEKSQEISLDQSFKKVSRLRYQRDSIVRDWKAPDKSEIKLFPRLWDLPVEIKNPGDAVGRAGPCPERAFSPEELLQLQETLPNNPEQKLLCHLTTTSGYHPVRVLIKDWCIAYRGGKYSI